MLFLPAVDQETRSFLFLPSPPAAPVSGCLGQPPGEVKPGSLPSELALHLLSASVLPSPIAVFGLSEHSASADHLEVLLQVDATVQKQAFSEADEVNSGELPHEKDISACAFCLFFLTSLHLPNSEERETNTLKSCKQ